MVPFNILMVSVAIASSYLVHEVCRLCDEDVLDDGNPVGVEGGRVVDGSSGVGAVLRLGGEEELRPLRLVIVLLFEVKTEIVQKMSILILTNLIPFERGRVCQSCPPIA